LLKFLTLLFTAWVLAAAFPATAQELEPRAYSPSPVDFNILVLGGTFNTGDITFSPALPVEDASADIELYAFGYVRTLGVAGRFASLSVTVPYLQGDLQGLLVGEFTEVRRSGFGDPRLRFSLNLSGTPALTAREFAAHEHRTNLGASLVVGLPLGQYDQAKIINIGANRWAFKPELGVTHRLGDWSLEGYAGVRFFTDNNDFAGEGTRTQDPLGITQIHAVYTFRPRLWAAFNANFFTGGRTTVNSARNADLQHNSRVGLTLSFPVAQKQSLKVAYSRGAFTNIGADFHTYALAYQWVWGTVR